MSRIWDKAKTGLKVGALAGVIIGGAGGLMAAGLVGAAITGSVSALTYGAIGSVIGGAYGAMTDGAPPRERQEISVARVAENASAHTQEMTPDLSSSKFQDTIRTQQETGRAVNAR